MATNLQFIKSASGSSVSSLDVTDCFSADYDVYYVSATKIDIATNYYNLVRVINASGVDTGANYDYAFLQMASYTTFSEIKSTTASQWFHTSYQSNGTADGIGFGMYIYNPYDSSSFTFMNNQASGFYSGNGLLGTKGIGVHHIAEQITGIQIYSVYNYDNITINVFGVK